MNYQPGSTRILMETTGVLQCEADEQNTVVRSTIGLKYTGTVNTVHEGCGDLVHC